MTTDPNRDLGVDAELAALLADYAAPVADDGFVDRVLREIGSRPQRRWAAPLIAASLGGAAALIWRVAGGRLPDSELLAVDPMSPITLLAATLVLLAGFALAQGEGWT